MAPTILAQIQTNAPQKGRWKGNKKTKQKRKKK